jgi:anaerobic magnesium-protoporphyrin IX monomethyl ester cyclase
LKILLIYPPVRVDQDPVDIPAGLAIMASIAIEEGHEVAFLDLNVKRPIPSWKYIRDQIAVEKWDIIGTGGLSSMYKDLRKILYLSRKLNPDALIVAGGGFITYMPDKIMKFSPEIDIAVLGEGEETWRELLQVADEKTWSQVKGICYKNESGNVSYTEPRPLIKDMDTIPYPAYDLLDMEGYFKYSNSFWDSIESFKSKQRINFQTERGCPRQCTFCTHNGMNRWDQEAMLGKDRLKQLDKEAGFQAVTRFYSVDYVINQIKFLNEKYGIDYVCILDENLTAFPKRVHEFCDKWISTGMHKQIKLGTCGDAPSLSTQICRKMKDAGFSFISIGGESGSDRVLKEDIGKGVTVAHNQQAADNLREVGMNPIMTFMVGNPNEDINDVLETVSFFIKNNISINPFICTPYPGTKIYMDYEDFILAQFDERLNILRKNTNIKIPQEKLSQWKDEALKKFLISLNNATDLSATVSQKFDHADLLAIRYFMHTKDTGKLLKLAHTRGWPHDEKWNQSCPVCVANEELSLKNTINN